MKLVRFGRPGEERPGVLLDAGRGILDVRALAYDVEDYNRDFFERGGLSRIQGLLREERLPCVSLDGVRLGPPVATPGQIVCVGRNYADHANEFGGGLPDRPELFGKAPSSWTGPCDPIQLPPGDAVACDTEVELGVVIGRRARRVSAGQALDYVAGYLTLNDVTDRRAQRAVSQWYYAKSADTFCPAGPWLATPDELGDVGALRLWSRLNGQSFQEASTQAMIFSVPYLLAYITDRVTLQPGDVLATGTPAGVGSARAKPRTLQPGDTVEAGVDGCGVQRCAVLAAPS